MLNIKYYKDLNHNFLILHSKIREEEQDYQYRMISGNKIRHLLECKIRYVNEECSFHYEISSKQSLKTLFERKPMGYGEMLWLLESIKEALDELESFLLDSRCLMLMPEHIYMEPETKQYFFLYYPCAEEEDKKEGMCEFARFLVDRAEHEQEEAVEMAYKIYESIQDEAFILPHILNMFRPSSIEAQEISVPQNKAEERDETDEANMDVWMEGEGDDGEEKQGKQGKVSSDESINFLPAVGILSLLCAAAAAGVFGIGYFFVLSPEEKLISTAGTIVLVALSAVLFLFFIINVCKRRNRQEEEGLARYRKETGSRTEKQGNEKNIYANPPERAPSPRAIMPRINELREEEYGNTVFLDTISYKKENKLYGTNKGNKYHIDLDKLPCTIGKLSGSVDVVIKDSTISRIHARLTNKEGEIYVTDMNSMNGTFKNGLRLEPNETVLIEQGDELRFGRMTFCYR